MAEAFQRYQEAYSLSELDADILTGDEEINAFFEGALAAHDGPADVSKFMINSLMGRLPDGGFAALPFEAAALGELVKLVDDGAISAKIAKDVLDEMLVSGANPGTIIAEKGLSQISDRDALVAVVQEVIDANPDKAAAYRSGKTGLKGFFMGQVMGATHGQANPQLVQELLDEAL